ncbi:hypothetical protein [Kitasatospora sp. NPDC058218]|uniref:hypothetical protein n=1 Tax=Kitasatospora sp. NPDC058218 TaxID=3346385 RepID=UPI0036D83307
MRAVRRRTAAAALALAAAAVLAGCGSDGGGNGGDGSAAGTACDGVVRTGDAEALLDEGAKASYRLDRQLDAAQQPGLQLLDCSVEAAKGLGLTVRLTGSETPAGGLRAPAPPAGEPVYALGLGDRGGATRWGADLTFRCDGRYLRAGAKALYFTVQAGPTPPGGDGGQAASPRWTPQAWARLAAATAERAARGPLGCTAAVGWPTGDPVLTPASPTGGATAGPSGTPA